jgi:hypothetical protein
VETITKEILELWNKGNRGKLTPKDVASAISRLSAGSVRNGRVSRKVYMKALENILLEDTKMEKFPKLYLSSGKINPLVEKKVQEVITKITKDGKTGKVYTIVTGYNALDKSVIEKACEEENDVANVIESSGSGSGSGSVSKLYDRVIVVGIPDSGNYYFPNGTDTADNHILQQFACNLKKGVNTNGSPMVRDVHIFNSGKDCKDYLYTKYSTTYEDLTPEAIQKLSLSSEELKVLFSKVGLMIKSRRLNYCLPSLASNENNLFVYQMTKMVKVDSGISNESIPCVSAKNYIDKVREERKKAKDRKATKSGK